MKRFQVYKVQEGVLYPLNSYDSVAWLRNYMYKHVSAGHEVYVYTESFGWPKWAGYSWVSGSGFAYLSRETEERLNKMPKVNA